MLKIYFQIFLICTQQEYLTIQARLAQSVERETFNLKAKGSSPLSGELFFSLKISIENLNRASPVCIILID